RGGLGGLGGGGGAAEWGRRLRVVLLRVPSARAPHRGEGLAPGEGPAAALRGVLRRRERAQVQTLRRHPSGEDAAGGMGEALVIGWTTASAPKQSWMPRLQRLCASMRASRRRWRLPDGRRCASGRMDTP